MGLLSRQTSEPSVHSKRRSPARRFGRLRSWCHALWLPLLSLGSCSQQDGFECGAPQRNNPEVIGRCSRNLEVCMCATLSCAVRDVGQFQGPAPEREEELATAGSSGSGGASGGETSGGAEADGGARAGDRGTVEPAPPPLSNICKSGYRYVGKPFASSSWADTCVPAVHLQTEMVGTRANPGPMCPTLPPILPGTGGAASGGSSGVSGAGMTIGGGGMSIAGAGGAGISGGGGARAGGAGGADSGASGQAPVGGMAGSSAGEGGAAGASGGEGGA